jgi:flagellar protein FlbD
MIPLTRLTGARFALNPDLVERVDCTPDTVITLVDGTKYLVSESLQDVVELVLDYRAQIVAGAGAIEHRDTSMSRRTRLSAVPPSPPLEEPGGGPTGPPGDVAVVSLEPRTV